MIVYSGNRLPRLEPQVLLSPFCVSGSEKKLRPLKRENSLKRERMKRGSNVLSTSCIQTEPKACLMPLVKGGKHG